MNCWLDSLNAGINSLEGLWIIPSTTTLDAEQQLYSNIRITDGGVLIIQNNIELMGNSVVIVESGGELLIDGGTFSNVELILKAGASLRIINNGVMEMRNSFDVPVGVTVDVVYGEITNNNQ